MELDYDELGFRCGIEIHQQLDTATKLFCKCSTEVENEAAVAKVRRNLRPVAGEAGDIDRAAKFEFLTEKEFVYNIYDDVSCLVELDEEPPHPINQEAMETALEIALLVDANVPDEIHVMRKTVIDGSNTTGFQRTAIVGLDGTLETEKGDVSIDDIELEEESSGIHARKQQRATFDLDRLGIPLIEIGTDDSIQDPEHAKAVAKRIGMLLRSTGNVKRGLGTIRQDVNVSIEGGARIEVKGFQDVANLDKLVRNEVRRQHELLQIKEDLEERGVETIDPALHDMKELFGASDNQIIGQVIEQGGTVVATTLPLEGLMNRELCEGKTLGKEFADYAKAHGVNGIMHTDEDVTTYGLEDEFDAVAEELGKKDGEVVVIVAGDSGNARQALEAVVERAAQCLEGVPEETRDANQDFTTSYSRPLPGSARMYPETDIPPFEADEDLIERLEADLPATLDERREQLADSIGEQLADQIVDSRRFPIFEALHDRFDVSDRDIANLLTNVVGDVESRHEIDVDGLEQRHFEQILALLEDDEVGKDALPVLVKGLAEKPSTTAEQVVEEEGLGAMDDEAVRSIVQDVLDANEEAIEEQGEHARGMLMGQIMDRVEGKADGSTVNRILSQELQAYLD